jgi:hypothetical protein
MYTDDEVEDIRDGDREEDTGGTDGYTSVKKLSGALFISFLSLSLVTYLTLGVGSSAVVVSGAGGFFADIDQIDANGAFIYPAVSQTANCPSDVTTADGRPEDNDLALPLLRVDLANAEIPNGNSVRFIKTIKTPGLSSFTDIDNFSLVVSQDGTPGKTQLKDTTVLVSELEGQNLGLGKTIANESFTRPASQNPAPRNEIFGPSVPNYFENNGLDKNMSVLGEFVIKGETASVTNAEGIAHLVSFESLTIPNLNLTLQYNQKGQYAPSGGCPV